MSRRERFFVCRERYGKQKGFRPHPGPLLAKNPRFMENRYLFRVLHGNLRPILHKNILLAVLRVSNEPSSDEDEWVVNIVLNYLVLSLITR